MTQEMGIPYSFASADAEFSEAWQNPKHTAIELPAVDVNKVLASRYVLDPPVHVTRSMVWDMEVKKSWDPLAYIPYVVSEARSWGRHPTEEGCEHFCRSSIQRAWITEQTGQVLEDVRINHKQQRVLFMGRASMTSQEGDTLRADGFQPLFHVEHAAGGTETAATNLWRIVILTGNRDDRYVTRFAAGENWLPGFLEIYIRRDLKANLRRREPVDHA